jgi:hypothetical protein
MPWRARRANRKTEIPFRGMPYDYEWAHVKDMHHLSVAKAIGTTDDSAALREIHLRDHRDNREGLSHYHPDI